MKNLISGLILIAFIMQGCGSSRKSATPPQEKKPVTQVSPAVQQKPVDFHDPSTWILGNFNADRLYQAPYSDWFLKGFDEYPFNSQVTDKLKSLITPKVSIKIVMGTWCPDSRREVPRFMRIMEVIGFPGDKVQLIGVDNSKVAPVDGYAALDIKRVPTFIIYKNNVEAGRIIENPVTSLEQDMVNILSKE